MVIINGRILTMEEQTIECGYVRTKGNKIEEVGDMTSFKRKKDNESVLDVKGAWVMPGLIESHCHIHIGETTFITAETLIRPQNYETMS